jgi:phage/plasmid-associated DNA primase
MEIVGSGSTGKSTYVNLIRAMINPVQATATTMGDLEGNRFESMNIQGKKLIYIADSEAYKGGGGKLKSLVSGDTIRAEKKFKDISYLSVKAFFVFVGNYPITSTDQTSGMIRRRILLNFNNISKSREKLIEINNNIASGPFSNEIPGFINYLLNNKEVYLNKLNSMIGNISAQNENYIFSFFNEYLIIDNEGIIYMGNNSKPFYSKNPQLYPLFLLYCKANKVKPISLFKFVEAFLDWARVNSVLLKKIRDKASTHYSGVKLNTENLKYL